MNFLSLRQVVEQPVRLVVIQTELLAAEAVAKEVVETEARESGPAKAAVEAELQGRRDQ